MDKIDLLNVLRYTPPGREIRFIANMSLNGSPLLVELKLDEMFYAGLIARGETEADEYGIPAGREVSY